MNDLNLKKNLQKAISSSKKNKYRKIIKAPIKMVYSETIRLLERPVKEKATTFWHDKMSVVLPEDVSMNIYRYGFFEEGLTRIVMEHLKPGMTFFDIGAHFGYFTLLGSYLIGHTGQVHSFEPTSSTFKIVRSNISTKSNIFLNNLAVFSEKKVISINDYGAQYSALNSIYDARLPQNVAQRLEKKMYYIDTISIDEYINEKNIKPDFIKIDAESSEFEILLGMKQTIERFHPIITVEVGDYEVEGVRTSKELIECLINKGYKAYEYKEGKILPHTPRNSYSYDNILFLPEE